MKILYYSEQGFESDASFEQLLTLLKFEAASKRYHLQRVEKLDTLPCGSPPLVMFIKTIDHLKWVLGKLLSNGIRAIVIDGKLESAYPYLGSVSVNYEAGMLMAIEHMDAFAEAKMGNKARLALVGVNSNHLCDRRIYAAFLENGGEEKAVFFNTISAEDTCRSFLKRAGCFEGVICSNYTTALMLKSCMKQMDITETLKLISFTEVFSSTHKDILDDIGIDTISADYREVAANIIESVRCIVRTKIPLNIEFRIMPRLEVHPPQMRRSKEQHMQTSSENDLLTGDCSISEINDFERCIFAFSKTDWKILREIKGYSTRSIIAEELHISESTLYERIRSICVVARQDCVKDVVKMLDKFGCFTEM